METSPSLATSLHTKTGQLHVSSRKRLPSHRAVPYDGERKANKLGREAGPLERACRRDHMLQLYLCWQYNAEVKPTNMSKWHENSELHAHSMPTKRKGKGRPYTHTHTHTLTKSIPGPPMSATPPTRNPAAGLPSRVAWNHPRTLPLQYRKNTRDLSTTFHHTAFHHPLYYTVNKA